MIRFVCRAFLLTFLIFFSRAAYAADLTFFAWSDQHVRSDGDAKHLNPVVEAMRQLPGKPYPPEIGGVVQPPAFVLGCGDCTDWPTRAAIRSYDRAVSSLPWPAYQIMGNHDEGDPSTTRTIDTIAIVTSVAVGLVMLQLLFLLLKLARKLRPRRTVRLLIAAPLALGAAWLATVLTAPDGQAMRRWIVARHGDVSYSFDSQGVHIVMLFSKYNPRQEITPQALAFLRTNLARIPKDQPVVIASHYCFESISNPDAYIDAMGNANVIVVLGGHYHQPTSNLYRGKRFIQVGSPRTGSTFTVVKISNSSANTAVWDFNQHRWRS